jgi:hypothetical protein
MALLPAKINVGADGPKAWIQANRTYGVNDSGAFQTISYRGTKAEVEDMVSTFLDAGWTYTVTLEKGGLATIEGSTAQLPSTSGAEIPEDVWELDPNETEKNLLDADFSASGALGNISAENRAIIKDALTRVGDFATSSPAFTGGTSAAAYSLFLLMANDVSSFPIEATIIRHTQTFSNTYVIPSGLYNNCNRIISRASMYSVEGVPTSILYAIPDSPTPTQYIESSGDLQYGWRKVRPSVTRLSRDRWRVTRNWQFGLWAIKLYGTVI